MLQAGADDFLKRNFNDTELVARVAALVRRSHRGYAPSVLKVRDLVVDLDSRQIKRGNTKITLRKKEFEILVYLMNSAGRIVSRDMILQNAWEVERENWHNTVDVHMKHLRDKVDKPFSRKPLIRSVYGMGYRME